MILRLIEIREQGESTVLIFRRLKIMYVREANMRYLLIAHSLSTHKDCSMLVKLDHGKIEVIGSYEELAPSISEPK